MRKGCQFPFPILSIDCRRFLLAQFHVDALASKPTRGEVRRALSHLPQKLDDSYNEIMSRIWSQGEEELKRAKQVLRWISCAKRPLTVIELQSAIGFEKFGLEIDEGELLPEAEMISVCAGIVTVDKQSNIIRLVHFSVQEYFDRIRESKFPDAQIDIARTCLTYLGFDVFNDPCLDQGSLEKRVEQYKLSHYAAQFWAFHAREGEKEPNIQRAVLSLLVSENKRNSMLQMETYANSNWGDIYFTKGQTLLHVIAKNGLATICGFILDAHKKGQLQILGLSETDVDVAAKDEDKRTPLSYAAGRGHVEAVRWLVEEGKAEVESKDDEYGKTPWDWAREGSKWRSGPRGDMIELLQKWKRGT